MAWSETHVGDMDHERYSFKHVVCGTCQRRYEAWKKNCPQCSATEGYKRGEQRRVVWQDELRHDR
jgi:predicted amidophosphoribosyltransferase